MLSVDAVVEFPLVLCPVFPPATPPLWPCLCHHHVILNFKKMPSWLHLSGIALLHPSVLHVDALSFHITFLYI